MMKHVIILVLLVISFQAY
ncbi:type I toxin-antitoxin system Ibs family toxin [Escherichia coli]|nr:type I toxin-antitoxin system Ibs family toxin [Escherichia coli]